MLPLQSIGMNLEGCKVTKRQLKKWTEEGVPHVVCAYTYGGIFTSKGNGEYQSMDHHFHDLESFWVFIRDKKRAFMYETK